jgi:hypothetical protein
MTPFPHHTIQPPHPGDASGLRPTDGESATIVPPCLPHAFLLGLVARAQKLEQ